MRMQPHLHGCSGWRAHAQEQGEKGLTVWVQDYESKTQLGLEVDAYFSLMLQLLLCKYPALPHPKLNTNPRKKERGWEEFPEYDWYEPKMTFLKELPGEHVNIAKFDWFNLGVTGLILKWSSYQRILRNQYFAHINSLRLSTINTHHKYELLVMLSTS